MREVSWAVWKVGKVRWERGCETFCGGEHSRNENQGTQEPLNLGGLVSKDTVLGAGVSHHTLTNLRDITPTGR